MRSEEDVKDAYILALGLKGHTKGMINIRTREIWFEAKDTGRYSSYAMFTQLLHYVHDALNKGDNIPPFLAVIDTEKAALIKSSDVLPFLKRKTVTWGKSASKYTPEALAEISAYIGTGQKRPSNWRESLLQPSKFTSAVKLGQASKTKRN